MSALGRGNVRDHIDFHKSDRRPSYLSTEPCSGGDNQKPTFARFSEPLVFRLFQQYLPEAEIAGSRANYERGRRSTPGTFGFNQSCNVGGIRGTGENHEGSFVSCSRGHRTYRDTPASAW